MCKRFSLSTDLEEVRNHFQVQRVMYYYKTRYNMSPTQHVPIILHQDGERILDEFRWGFMPFWGKDCVNAELSTVRVNSSYRKMAETRLYNSMQWSLLLAYEGQKKMRCPCSTA